MPTQLSQVDMQSLMGEGYTTAEINEALREVESEELQQSYGTTQGTDPRAFARHSQFAPQLQDNLIKWQLELDNILERAEHILRADILKFEGGNLIWIPNPKPENNILNDYGVGEVMRILSMYLNRNTILSDYEPEEIREKVYDFGKELNDLFYMKYETMGLTNLEKRKNFPILHREIMDIIHSAYKRALQGGERRSLREARQVTQTEPLMPQGVVVNAGMMQQRNRGVLNPMRYIVGKQK